MKLTLSTALITFMMMIGQIYAQEKGQRAPAIWPPHISPGAFQDAVEAIESIGNPIVPVF